MLTFKVDADYVKKSGLRESAVRLAALVKLYTCEEIDSTSAGIGCDIHGEMKEFANAIWDAWKDETE